MRTPQMERAPLAWILGYIMRLVEYKNAVGYQMAVTLQDSDIENIVVWHDEEIAVLLHVLRIVWGAKFIFLAQLFDFLVWKDFVLQTLTNTDRMKLVSILMTGI